MQAIPSPDAGVCVVDQPRKSSSVQRSNVMLWGHYIILGKTYVNDVVKEKGTF